MNPRIRSVYGGTASMKLAFYSYITADGCIFWTGHKDSSGYGVIWYDGKLHKAHRLALSVALGRPLQPGMMALHHCHRPPCINADHLYEGTQHDNMADMDKAGRRVTVRGAAHPLAKFTDAQIEAIRKDTRPRRHVLAEYGLGASHYHRIKNGLARRR